MRINGANSSAIFFPIEMRKIINFAVLLTILLPNLVEYSQLYGFPAMQWVALSITGRVFTCVGVQG